MILPLLDGEVPGVRVESEQDGLRLGAVLHDVAAVGQGEVQGRLAAVLGGEEHSVRGLQIKDWFNSQASGH